jgi:hypothetical protein
MNLEQIEREIENEENLKLNYIRLKRIQQQSKELIASIKGIQRREQLLARERRNKVYKDNPEHVIIRAAIKESFIDACSYVDFIIRLRKNHDVSSDEFELEEESYLETNNISGLLEKLNHLAQFIK